MLLSYKKRSVLASIDRFGAATIAQIDRYLSDISYPTIFRAKDHLSELGFIHERYYGKRKLLAVTLEGARYVGYHLKGVSLTNNDMYHRLISNEVLLKYFFEYRDIKGYDVFFMTEREIITERQVSMSPSELKKPNRAKYLYKEVPDIVLKINGKVLAFEIELSRKTNKRIEDKIKKYKFSNTYDGVIYICANDIIRRAVKKTSDRLNFDIDFLMLDHVINPMEV